ncbi:NirA family protein [Algisphaera agarilytica]|uniref:Ferredoxin-nitrite reductase n=1 Tax=Algisphaera agarilytica TaxID=1385975 RepID=A0A7X0LL88_9BACT|nr:NirA family protein [Algisphaera agarilytica]MBB6431250.1 ferredoxin-nitrite reductase [Algisphaera agarilytica]
MPCDGKSSLAHAPLDGFTDEQRDYLASMLDQMDLNTVYKAAHADETGDGGNVNGARISVFGTPLEDLCTQEQLKLAEHPDEMWPKLRAHAAEAKMPEGGDTFMFKHHGLFNVQPAQPGFMCRMRIPACKLTANQFEGLGDLAENLAGGYAHVTTRGNLQVREIQPQNIINLLEGLYDLGLTCKGSGADSVRNITANPTAGFDPQELMDLSPYAKALHLHILNTPSLHGIPRKFNIAFDGGGVISAVVDTNDIGFVAHKLTDEYLAANPEVAAACPDGIVIRILLGGITGHHDFAISSGFACTPDQMNDFAIATLDVFTENGDRTNRKKARLKYVLDDWGHTKFTETVEERLPFKLLRLPEDATHPRGPIDRQMHIGVHPQAPGPDGEDLRFLGVSLWLGRLSPEQMRGIAAISKKYGQGDIRLTVWQNVLIPHVPADQVDAAIADLNALGLDVSASSFAAGVVACTGKFACQFASAHTKEHGQAAVEHLQTKFELDSPINIHLTGCTHSCAQHYIGDIGLVGASTEDGREAYNVVLGGGSDHDQGIARPLTGPVAYDELNPFLEGVIGTYLENREDDETFLSFTRRHDDDALKQLFLKDAPLAEVTSS